MAWYDLFVNRRGNKDTNTSNDIIDGVNTVKEGIDIDIIREVKIVEDNRGNTFFDGNIESIHSKSINEGVSLSPSNLQQLLGTDDNNTLGQIIDGIRGDYSLNEIFLENEEMSRDSVIGSAMEIIADDSCTPDETTNRVVMVESTDEGLKKFIEDFLFNNVKVEDRIWSWAYEIVKHGDFKLRRREYYAGSVNSGIKSVYYEDVINPYLVSRIEYMGNILGYEDEDYLFDSGSYRDAGQFSGGVGGSTSVSGSAKFEKSDEFVHFISSKLSKREKIKLNVRKSDNTQEEVTCYRVVGTSIVDSARTMFRINALIDNILVLSRIARSTQFNLVKVEVGNANPGQTQQMLSDVRRRFQANSKLSKGVGFRSDPSPVPINSNIYLPTRDGKGDVTVDSVGDSIDVQSIVDVDYFTDKLFASLKVPKQYLGFAESLGSMGNNSLVKQDLRYARSVIRVQQILINGIMDLCENYLRYRGRGADIGAFRIYMRPLPTSETATKVEEYVSNLQMIDSSSAFLESYADYIDKAKWLKAMLNLANIDVNEVATDKFKEILKAIDDGEYVQSDFEEGTSEEDSQDSPW